jgi:hypothetical protein
MPLSPVDLEAIAHARATDGNTPGGLERVVRAAQAAARAHQATNLAELRPDLADEDPDFTVPKAAVIRSLIRPVGPRFRLTKVGVVRTRQRLGLS